VRNLGDALKAQGIDSRTFEQGAVYLASDSDVKIPDEKLTGRTLHEIRPVVIVSNHPSNRNPLYPTVLAAPLSHDTSRKRDTDLEVTAAEDNVDQDSLLRLGLIQPFLKVDLKGPVAQLSQQRVEQMLALLLHMLGVDMEDSAAAVDLIF